MNKNLVIAAAVGFKIDQLSFFIRSLRMYYKDDICFVIGQNDLEVEKELKKYQVIIIKTKIFKKAIQFKRYEIFLEFFKNKNYNNILCCDSRDIYFQSNPFNFNFKGKINFFLEDKQIKECPYNSNWIIKTYGKKVFNNIGNKTILCSGTVLGKSEKIKEYLYLMKKNISKFKYKKRLKYFLTFRIDPEGRGCDQGHANYVVHKNLIKDSHCYPNSEGPFATVYYLKNITFDKNSRLLNSLGEAYLLVHQYDKRWEEFSKQVEEIKKNLTVS